MEDLDAVLAASAPLAPFNLESTAPELARILAPLPERAFDPRLLIVEREDPMFALEIGRLAAERQDWRQRRDVVRDRMMYLQNLIDGPRRASVQSRFEPGQIEPEPVEILADLGFAEALLSPGSSSILVQSPPTNRTSGEFSSPAGRSWARQKGSSINSPGR
jgi:hypothetical protein